MPGLRRTLREIGRAATTRVDVERANPVDPELITVLAPWLDRLCRAWFRLEIRGLERVPGGKALLVGNHNSGITFVEAMGVCARWYLERGLDEPWYGMAHDAIIDMPGLGNILAHGGALRASHDTAESAFARGGKVAVFPGGNGEAFRPWRDRHHIAFGNHRGFVRLAIRHQVPIVPFVYIGGHDGFFVLRDGRRLARLLRTRAWARTDTWPLVLGLPWGLALGPWFHLPLPVKCVTSVLDPIPVDTFAPEEADDPHAVGLLYDRVVDAMQEEMDRLAEERRERGIWEGLPWLGRARGADASP